MIKDSATGGANIPRINEERLIHALSCMLGENITVTLDSGSTLQGVFQGFDPMSRGSGRIADIAVSDARFVTPEDDKAQGRPMIVAGSDYHYFTGVVPSKYHSHFMGGAKAQQRKFKTDVEISESKPRNSQQHEHGNLTEWQPDSPLDDDEYVELEQEAAAASANDANTSGDSASGSSAAAGNLGGSNTGWNQFEANSKAFGITSTYDETVYTTPLDLSTIPPQVQDRAGYLAREISSGEGSGTFGHLDNLLEEDEDEAGVNMEHLQLVQKTMSKFGRELKKREKPAATAKKGSASDIQAPVAATTSSSFTGTQQSQNAQVASEGEAAALKRVEKYSHQIALNTLNLEPGSAAASVTLPPARQERSIMAERKGETRHLFDMGHAANSASANANAAEGSSASHTASGAVSSGSKSHAVQARSLLSTSTAAQRQNALLKSQDQALVVAGGADGYKKSFKFNPNATTFTPGSSDATGRAQIGGGGQTRSLGPTSPPKGQGHNSNLQPPPPPPTPLLMVQKVGLGERWRRHVLQTGDVNVTSSSGNATDSATASSSVNLGAAAVPLKTPVKMSPFEPFKFYGRFPRLDLSEFRRRFRHVGSNKSSGVDDQGEYSDKWPCTSDVSYRMVFEQALANKGLMLLSSGNGGAALASTSAATVERNSFGNSAGVTSAANDKTAGNSGGGGSSHLPSSSSHHHQQQQQQPQAQAHFSSSSVQVTNSAATTTATATAPGAVMSQNNVAYVSGLSLQQLPHGLASFAQKQPPPSNSSANGRQHHHNVQHQGQQVLIQRPRGPVPPPGYYMPQKK